MRHPLRSLLAPGLLVLGILAMGVGAGHAQVPAEQATPPTASLPRVALDTSMGRIVLELESERAPITVDSFLRYVRDGFYDGTIFHRVIPGFMVQGGGFTADLTQKKTAEPVRNESVGGLSNLRGTVAMARSSDPHSATAQFFVNTVDNARLDARGEAWGYTVFARVVDGMEVVDAIAKVPTGSRRAGTMPMQDVPLEPVTIERAVVLDAP